MSESRIGIRLHGYDEEEQGPVLTEESRVADRMLPGGAW